MAYNVIVTERAEMQLDQILNHVLYRFQNKQAAKAILADVKKTYERLEMVAGSIGLCEDSYLAEKGYHKIAMEKHSYILLYQIEGKDVYVNGIFHMLEDYRKKL